MLSRPTKRPVGTAAPCPSDVAVPQPHTRPQGKMRAQAGPAPALRPHHTEGGGRKLVANCPFEDFMG